MNVNKVTVRISSSFQDPIYYINNEYKNDKYYSDSRKVQFDKLKTKEHRIGLFVFNFVMGFYSVAEAKIWVATIRKKYLTDMIASLKLSSKGQELKRKLKIHAFKSEVDKIDKFLAKTKVTNPELWV